MGLVSSIGGLIGMAVGGPAGAAIGSGIGSLASGGNLQDAIMSGIGSLANPVGGKLGAGLDVLGALGGGNFSQAARGQGLADAFGKISQGGNPAEALAGARGQGQYGGITQGIGSILDITGITQNGKINDPILAAIVMDQISKPKPAMTPLQQRQYDTGERVPDYRGTAVPNVPRVRYAAKGGYIQGPGTGTSDSIPAMIYQDGGPVQEARLSDGEFVMTEEAVRGAGQGDRNRGAAEMYRMMNQFERRA